MKPTVYSIMTHTHTQTHRCEARAHILMNAFKAQIQCEFTVHINKHRNSTFSLALQVWSYCGAVTHAPIESMGKWTHLNGATATLLSMLKP